MGRGGAMGEEPAGSPQCFEDGEQGRAAELFLLTVKVGSWEQPAHPVGLLAQSFVSAALPPCEGYLGRLVQLCSECKWQTRCFVHDLRSGRMEPRWLIRTECSFVKGATHTGPLEKCPECLKKWTALKVSMSNILLPEIKTYLVGIFDLPKIRKKMNPEEFSFSLSILLGKLWIIRLIVGHLIGSPGPGFLPPSSECPQKISWKIFHCIYLYFFKK